MRADCLTVPPLPILELSRWKSKRPKSRSHPRVLPRALEDELTRIARTAVRSGIDPILSASPDLSDARARALLERSFRAFLRERNRVWPPLLKYMAENWLKLLPLLREVAALVRRERMRVPVPDVQDDGPGARSLMRFGIALQTYEMTLHLTLGSIPSFLTGIATGKMPKGLEDTEGVVALLNRVDVATAALEFGTIAGVRLLDCPDSLDGHVFGGVTEYAARGADEQHVLIRGVLRSVIAEEPMVDAGEVAEGNAETEVPPEALFADWARAVLAI